MHGDSEGSPTRFNQLDLLSSDSWVGPLLFFPRTFKVHKNKQLLKVSGPLLCG